jgi:hypothetical protein
MRQTSPLVFAIGAILTLTGVLATMAALNFDPSLWVGSGVFVVLLWFWGYLSSRRKTRTVFR